MYAPVYDFQADGSPAVKTTAKPESTREPTDPDDWTWADPKTLKANRACHDLIPL
jgi:hypothetical protein